MLRGDLSRISLQFELPSKKSLEPLKGEPFPFVSAVPFGNVCEATDNYNPEINPPLNPYDYNLKCPCELLRLPTFVLPVCLMEPGLYSVL
jgi:hypothetical protein